MVERGKGPFLGLFYKGTNPIHEGTIPSWFKHPPNAPFPNTITLGVRISICEFWGDTNIQCIAATQWKTTGRGRMFSYLHLRCPMLPRLMSRFSALSLLFRDFRGNSDPLTSGGSPWAGGREKLVKDMSSTHPVLFKIVQLENHPKYKENQKHKL